MTGDPVPGKLLERQVGHVRRTDRLEQVDGPWLAGLPGPGLAVGDGPTLAR